MEAEYTKDKHEVDLVRAEIFKLGFDYVEKYPKHIDVVTAADIKRAANERLSTTCYSLVIAGPEGTPGLDS